jgi:acetyl-CoA carboxylase carboxyltransferase component
MTTNASIALSGPSVVASAIGELVDHGDLGGPEVAAGVVGTAHAVVDDEEQAIARLRHALAYFPDHADEPAPLVEPVPPATEVERLETLIPAVSKQGYDMRKVLDCIVDGGSLLPWRGDQAKNLITAFARIEGSVVGMVANQPMHRAGTLDVMALEKYLDFINVCDLFNVPLVQLHDVPGLMIGTQEERRGILRYLELVASRLSTVAVPRVSVILRKSYGGGYFLMGGAQTSPDLLVAWPTAEMGFMTPESGVRTVHRGELAEELEHNGEDARDKRFEDLVEEWSHESEPWEAAAHFYLDDVIEPHETRAVIHSAIEFAWGTRRRVSRVVR